MPADVIKTRMIAQILHGGERKYKHTLDCIVKTVRSEGLRERGRSDHLRLAPANYFLRHVLFFGCDGHT